MSVNKFILCQVLGSACAIPRKKPDKRIPGVSKTWMGHTGVILGPLRLEAKQLYTVSSYISTQETNE